MPYTPRLPTDIPTPYSSYAPAGCPTATPPTLQHPQSCPQQQHRIHTCAHTSNSRHLRHRRPKVPAYAAGDRIATPAPYSYCPITTAGWGDPTRSMRAPTPSLRLHPCACNPCAYYPCAYYPCRPAGGVPYPTLIPPVRQSPLAQHTLPAAQPPIPHACSAQHPTTTLAPCSATPT